MDHDTQIYVLLITVPYILCYGTYTSKYDISIDFHVTSNEICTWVWSHFELRHCSILPVCPRITSLPRGSFIISPASTKLKGGYTGSTLSVSPSVRLWTESCPLCIFNNTNWSISYLHILSSNFRRCVACNVCFRIDYWWTCQIYMI